MSLFFDLQTMMLDHCSLIHRQHCDVILLWFTDCLKWCHYSWYDVPIHWCTEVCDITILLFTYWNDVTIVNVMPLFFDSQTVMGRPYCLIFFIFFYTLFLMWCHNSLIDRRLREIITLLLTDILERGHRRVHTIPVTECCAIELKKKKKNPHCGRCFKINNMHPSIDKMHTFTQSFTLFFHVYRKNIIFIQNTFTTSVTNSHVLPTCICSIFFQIDVVIWVCDVIIV